MRLSDLWDAKVKTLDGDTLGRVHDVHAEGGRIVALTCGVGSFVERLTARKHGRRVPWECVARIGKGEIFITPDPPKKAKPAGARSRRGTRRASAPRSKR